MRVNIISNLRPNTGLMQDVNLLRGIITIVFGENVQIKLVQCILPQCDEADVNIFVEFINPSLFSYAGKNIWIPNHESTYKSWIPYLHMVNEIWVKTHEAERVFKELTPTHVRYIGWTSINKQTPKRKNYYKAIVPVGKNMCREVDVLLNAYMHIKRTDTDTYGKLPVLNIITWRPVNVPEPIKDIVFIHNKILTPEEYDEILLECGVCICLSKAEGFGHAVNEAMASGCNLIVSGIPPFLEDLVGINVGAHFTRGDNKPNEECFGNIFSTDMHSLVDILENFTDLTFKQKQESSELIRQKYETRHNEWVEIMKSIIPPVFVEDIPVDMPKEEDLPNVSIICITRDRRIFMPVLNYSYMIQSYPEEKMELIVVDDGDDPVEDCFFGVPNVVYVRLDEKKTIGEKRNIGVSKAMYDVITFMDDDDVYPNNSVLHRASMMLKQPSKECAFCTTIPCYDIAKYSSFMNAPPLKLEMSERVSEATLVFTKKFWEDSKFPEIQIAEGDAFIRGREHMCRELSPQEVIVSLVHPLNTSSRKIPEFKEPNGCHYGFNEKLFAMVSEIGQKLTTLGEPEHLH
jgi:hypothetical protein